VGDRRVVDGWNRLSSRTRAWRRLSWTILLFGSVLLALLKWSDAMSQGPDPKAEHWRLLCANVKDDPLAVADALRQYSPDLVALQETGTWGSCGDLARKVGYGYWSGADQCVLASARWQGSSVEWRSGWPGARQQPQQVKFHGTPGIVLVNLHLAKPGILESVGKPALARQTEYRWLRESLPGNAPTLVCGDFNAFPWQVDLGIGFADSWRRRPLGATFPAWLPIARIDQCWSSKGIAVRGAWTAPIPSDHRAIVVDFDLDGIQGENAP
jgi:endonuclease/exonuclease/phosphatase (EEP) superfamily protein YafD